MATARRAVGIFGGSFNPVHLGHVKLAEQMQAKVGFDPLYIIPSKNPPHKPPYEVSDIARLEMARFAFEGLKHTEISTVELEADGPSYAIRTIELLTRKHPGAELFFILGADAFHDLPHWYAFPDVLEACSYIVVARAGWDDGNEMKLARRLEKLVAAGLLKLSDASEPPFAATFLTRTGGRVCVFNTTLPEVSSTEVRLRMQLTGEATGLVPDAVARYLKTNGLYGSPKP